MKWCFFQRVKKKNDYMSKRVNEDNPSTKNTEEKLNAISVSLYVCFEMYT